MNDTRVLLNRIAEFRKRLDAMPRLVPTQTASAPAQTVEPPPEKPEAGSPTQAILEYSLRQLATMPQADPPPLGDSARRLMAEAQGMVTRMRALADDPLLGGPAGEERAADPLAAHFRETAALVGAAVRYAATFPPSADEQDRLCEGLEGMIDAARRRFALLAGTLERRRAEETRIEQLARFLVSIDTGTGPLDPAPVLELADAIIVEEPGRPLRFAAAHPMLTRAYLGGTEFPAPARFVAAHALNCASVLARVTRYDSEWKAQARDVVVAALLHDVGMLRGDPALLAQPKPLDRTRRKAVEQHPVAGAERLAARLPGLTAAAAAAADHHERADGSGYPNGRAGDQIAPVARLVAAADVYAAMCAPRPHRPAHDPRAALTDVMLLAEGGRLDRYAAETLLGLGLYPAGTVVELADGSTAVVVASRDPRSDTRRADRPLVGLLADADDRALPTPRYVDLADAGAGRVVRAVEPLERLRILARSYPEWA